MLRSAAVSGIPNLCGSSTWRLNADATNVKRKEMRVLLSSKEATWSILRRFLVIKE